MANVRIDNPAFRVTPEQIRSLRDASVGPKPPRPLVILSGYHSPAFPGWTLARLLESCHAAVPERTLVVSYPLVTRVEVAAEQAAAAIEARGWTKTELDVAGISMGGIVGRFLASERGLHIARLFTLASPHRGAKITRRIRPDAGAVQLAPGSTLLTHLDATLEGSVGELTCYSLLRDWMVGATNTSPPGHPSLWLDTDRWLAHPLSHFSITSDLRIVGDLALRLTGQSPWSNPGPPPPRD
jgi:pimeloyl-ACP methyl ester carboxylesterase